MTRLEHGSVDDFILGSPAKTNESQRFNFIPNDVKQRPPEAEEEIGLRVLVVIPDTADNLTGTEEPDKV